MKISVVVLLLFLAACQVLDREDAARADLIPMGTPVDLDRDLTIPPGQAGVFIRGTRIGDRYRYDANCRLEVRTLSETPRTVVADRFTIERVVQQWERFTLRDTGLRRVRLRRRRPRAATVYHGAVSAFGPPTRRLPIGLRPLARQRPESTLPDRGRDSHRPGAGHDPASSSTALTAISLRRRARSSRVRAVHDAVAAFFLAAAPFWCGPADMRQTKAARRRL